MDDYPRVATYVDEDLTLPKGPVMDEDQEHFEGWMESKKDGRRAPILYVTPETPWVGSKKDMYVKKTPTWLNKAYTKMVLGANKWRKMPSKYKKDFSEVHTRIQICNLRL